MLFNLVKISRIILSVAAVCTRVHFIIHVVYVKILFILFI